MSFFRSLENDKYECSTNEFFCYYICGRTELLKTISNVAILRRLRANLTICRYSKVLYFQHSVVLRQCDNVVYRPEGHLCVQRRRQARKTLLDDAQDDLQQQEERRPSHQLQLPFRRKFGQRIHRLNKMIYFRSICRRFRKPAKFRLLLSLYFVALSILHSAFSIKHIFLIPYISVLIHISQSEFNMNPQIPADHSPIQIFLIAYRHCVRSNLNNRSSVPTTSVGRLSLSQTVTGRVRPSSSSTSSPAAQSTSAPQCSELHKWVS